jgi:hypothetical protein
MGTDSHDADLRLCEVLAIPRNWTGVGRDTKLPTQLWERQTQDLPQKRPHWNARRIAVDLTFSSHQSED